jgi:hypothetical protein
MLKKKFQMTFLCQRDIFKIAREEVEELFCIGILEPNVYSEWRVPCLYRAKKNGSVNLLLTFAS